MSVRKVFQNLKNQNRAAFIPYVTVGDPNLEVTEALVQFLAEEGADFIELGVPFSDPVADGPVIQRASERALCNQIQLKDVLLLVARLRSNHFTVPLILFSYFNPIHKFGIENFAKAAKEVGVSGVLVVDLPPEEAESYTTTMKRYCLECIFLASPTTSQERLKLIDQCSSGFVYYISKMGVTGASLENSISLQNEIREIRKEIQSPLAIGFGVSSPHQAREMAQISDGVIVGSAIVREIEGVKSIAEMKQRVGKVVRPLVSAVREVRKCSF